MRLHCITLHCITFTTLTLNIILYMGVRGHANVWSQIKPSGNWRSGVWAPGRGHSSTWLIMPNTIKPKQVRHAKSWQLRPVCPQFIAKANPTPASKLAFVILISKPWCLKMGSAHKCPNPSKPWVLQLKITFLLQLRTVHLSLLEDLQDNARHGPDVEAQVRNISEGVLLKRASTAHN